MDDHSIREAMLMSSISKYPVNITDGWVAWSNIVITKRMALAFLTKLYGGPLPRLMYDVLYEGYASDIEQVPEEYRLFVTITSADAAVPELVLAAVIGEYAFTF